MSQSLKKMTLTGLILMIFTSVFGFANSPSAFYLMGYSATPFYIVSALFFFIPFALMMAEMGSAYRKEEGGIYSWMNNSVGPRYAFIGTFMWSARRPKSGCHSPRFFSVPIKRRSGLWRG